jgi:hypothetical protein
MKYPFKIWPVNASASSMKWALNGRKKQQFQKQKATMFDNNFNIQIIFNTTCNILHRASGDLKLQNQYLSRGQNNAKHCNK